MTPRSRRRLARFGTLAAPWVIGWGALCTASVSVRSLGPGVPDPVPSFLADAARTSVADFVCALAEAGVPAGFVLVEGDFDDEAIRRSGIAWHLRAAKDTRTIPLGNVVAAFRERYPAYEVEDRDGALVVRASVLGVVRLLEARVDRFRLNATSLGSAFNEAERIVDATIPVRGGLVGSVASNPDEPPATLTEMTIDLDVRNATLFDALNQIVQQAPGTVWVLSRHRNGGEYYTLAYRSSGGLMARFDDPLRVPRKK